MIVVKHVASIFGSLLPIRLSTFKLIVICILYAPVKKNKINKNPDLPTGYFLCPTGLQETLFYLKERYHKYVTNVRYPGISFTTVRQES